MFDSSSYIQVRGKRQLGEGQTILKGDIVLRQSQDMVYIHLKRLVLWDIDLSSVSPDLFGRAVTKLDLISTELTPEQGEAIFANLGQEETKKLKLRRVLVGSNNLSCEKLNTNFISTA